ncbi:MAG: M23 family metallopeptidase [Chloroflexota bacterium]
MLLSTVLPIISHVIVPAAFIVTLWRSEPVSRIAWMARVLAFGGFILFLFFAGAAWSWVSYYLRYVFLVLFIAAAIISWRNVWDESLPWWRRPPSMGEWLNFGVEALLGAYFLFAIAGALSGLSYGDARAAQLTFPLDDGVYIAGHGGDSPALNYHNVNEAQQYALDILALNAAGVRALGVYPTDLDRYVAFGRDIYSPCAGEIIEVVDDLPDLQPPEMDSDNLAGNHVVVRCAEQEVDVALAHMMAGSVTATEGQTVEAGEALGRLGNSGNTSEPHLHIHAVRTGSGSMLDGQGVPILFDGRFLVRNSLVFQ